MKHFKQPDALRGIFTLFVIASHWMPHEQNTSLIQAEAYKITSLIGVIGMYFFFVLSGFLISGILLSNRLKAEQVKVQKTYVWKNFFIRRTLRIFPVYYACLAVLYFFNISWFRGPAIWHFGYMSNIYFYQRNGWDLGGHLWSLSAEEQFYILWPILMLFTPIKYLKRVIVGLLILAPIFRLVMNFYNPSVFTQLLTPGVLDGFALGALLALWKKVPVFTKTDQQISKFTAVCGWVGLILITLFYLKPFNLSIWEQFNPFNDIFYRSSYALIGVFLVHKSVIGFRGFLKMILENPIALYLGKISYALYLFHNFQLHIFEWFKIPLPITGWYLIVHFVILITISSLSWYLFELPINNLKRFFPYVKKQSKTNSVADGHTHTASIGME